MTADPHVLTGAYALDAVTREEQHAFERHLGRCEACVREVAGLRETAARLGLAAAVAPPAGLRRRVLTAVHGARQDAAVITLRTRLFATAASVLLVVAAALGVTLANTNQNLDAVAVATVLRADDATLAQRDVDGGRVTLVVSRHLDRMMLMAQLPPPPSGRTYQAWTVDARYHSAGLLTPDGNAAALAMDHVGSVTAVAVTVEPGGGSPLPTSEPVVTVSVP